MPKNTPIILCIVIDDEPLALRQIVSYIKKTPFLILLDKFENPLPALSFIEKNTVERLAAAGVELKVLYPLSLRLISFNPQMEDGSPVNNPGIVDELRRAVSVPVYDLGPALA